MSNPILIYCPFKSNRLLYVLDWVFKKRLGLDYILTDKAPENSGFYISYGKIIPNTFCIPSVGLLNETGITQHEITTGEWNHIPTLYANAENTFSIPFDLFSAIFFLLSRYEEYYSFTPDKHERYPATDSILYKNGFLERPLIDEWLEQLRLLLVKQMGNIITPKLFSYLPTYDIDIAWSYKNKGLLRSVGGFAKDVLSFDGAQLKRLAVLLGGQDPYDSFEFLQTLHSKYGYKPLYFILSALQTGPFDKNIHPMHPAMQKLIQSFTKEGIVGIHPSYETKTNRQRFADEKTTLEKIIGQSIKISRQHYIRLVLPETYRQLIADGISDDYSMGYGTALGFRAGTGNAFSWYDIEKEAVTSLMLHPFCFMDSTAHYELKLSAEEAFGRLEKMASILKQCNSQLITVFHNFSLGTDAEWIDWSKYYSSFIEKISA